MHFLKLVFFEKRMYFITVFHRSQVSLGTHLVAFFGRIYNAEVKYSIDFLIA